MIKIEDVNFKYNKTNKVLNNLNVEINDGEIVAIVGENGAGKSTFAKLIAGIIKTKKGKILIDNLDISKKENYKDSLKKVGIVFQNPENQIIFSNIYDEFKFSMQDLSKEEVEDRIKEALKKVKMDEFVNRNLYELSLGQKQRVVIAEVLAKKPKYIVFDEPTTMIDSLGKEEIYEIIKNLKQEGYTIIYITNFSEEILLADRILILEDGSISEEIKKEELIDKADILLKHNIKLPIVLQMAIKLNKVGIKTNFKEFNIDEIIQAVKERIK